MSLLREIQDAAVSTDTRISDLLRKAKILAVRLGSEDLEQWVDWELNGYPSKDELPPYRRLSGLQSLGHFAGPFGSGAKNAPIPPSCLPEEYRSMITEQYLTEGIGAYEDLLRSKKGSFQSAWPTDLLRLHGQDIYEAMNCVSAWKVIPRGSIVSLVDSVRNRLLNFVLEIEKMNPDAGEASPQEPPTISQERVQQVFNTHIYGTVGNIAAGNRDVIQTAHVAVRQGDLESLFQQLERLGIEEADRKELKSALAAGDRTAGKGFGAAVSGWIGKMIGKASEGAIQVSVGTASKLLPKLIGQYLGLPVPD